MSLKTAAYYLFTIRYPNPDERPLFEGKTEAEWVEKAKEVVRLAKEKDGE